MLENIQAYTLKLRHTGSSNMGRGGEGALISEDVSLTLATSQDQTIFQEVEGFVDPIYPVEIADGSKWVVRRLTPVECERLMGFPDGWTDIGEYTDSRGRSRQTTDSNRYKALGNSMAVSVMLWLGLRLEEVDVCSYRA